MEPTAPVSEEQALKELCAACGRAPYVNQRPPPGFPKSKPHELIRVGSGETVRLCGICRLDYELQSDRAPNLGIKVLDHYPPSARSMQFASSGPNAHTTVTSIPIDHKRARRSK